MSNNPIATQSKALLDMVEAWRCEAATGGPGSEVAFLLRHVAELASDLAEMVDEESPWGTTMSVRHRLDPLDPFADVIDEWGDFVPESWL